MQRRFSDAGQAAGETTEGVENARTETPLAMVLPHGVVQLAGAAQEFEFTYQVPLEQV